MTTFPSGGPVASRPSDVAGTLRLMTYLALALALIVLDHRGGWLRGARAQAELLVQPLWQLAGAPARLGGEVRDNALTRNRLAEENRMLRNALLISGARVARLQAAAAETERARALLNAADHGRLDVQLLPILDIDLDPSRQRLVLAAGRNAGVQLGQAVIDDGGLMGQIITVAPGSATVLLLTDAGHAVPAQVARSGVRMLVLGTGRSDRLTLANVPLTADIAVGDALITSGLGDRFPAGFAIGTVTALRPDESRTFLTGDVRPAAHFDRGREVLLLRTSSRASAQPAGAAADLHRRMTAIGLQAHASPMQPPSPLPSPAEAAPTDAAGASAPAQPASAPPEGTR